MVGHSEIALELLRKAELYTEPSFSVGGESLRLRLRGIVFNNMGCLFKRVGQTQTALTYLEKALQIEVSTENVDNPASTHLNLCAVLSQLGRYALRSHPFYFVRLLPLFVVVPCKTSAYRRADIKTL